MLKPLQIDMLVDALVEKQYRTGEKIIRQGDHGDTLFVIKAGAVRVSLAVQAMSAPDGSSNAESGDDVCALLLQSASLLGKYEEDLFARSGSYSTA